MKGHSFLILGTGNRMRFHGGRLSPFRNSGELGFTKGQVDLARFIFDELLDYHLYGTNFLLTSRVRRTKVESRLKVIIEDNEW